MPPTLRHGVRRAVCLCTIAFFVLVIFSVGGGGALATGPGARSPRVAYAPPSAAPRSAPGPSRARPQQDDTAKRAALEEEGALASLNSTRDARARAIMLELDRLEVKLKSTTVGRKQRAKLESKLHVLAAELDVVLPRFVSAPVRSAPEVEPNDAPRSAMAVELKTGQAMAVAGSIVRPGDVDVFSFEAPAGARVWAYVDPSASSLVGTGTRDSALRLLDASGVATLEADDDDATGNNFGRQVGTTLASAIAGAVVPAEGRYYVEVRAFDASRTMDSYKLVLAVSVAQPASETRSNDAAGYATPLLAAGATLGVVSATIESPGDADMYSVDALSGRLLFVAIDGDPERDGTDTNTTVELVGLDGTRKLITANSANGGPLAEAFAIVVPAAGRHFLRVSHDSSTGTGTYQILAAVDVVGGGVGIPTGPFCGTTTGAPDEQIDTLDSDGIVSACGTAKTCPGGSGPDVTYVANAFTNTTGSDVCVTVNATSTCNGNSRVVIAAYLGSFNPNDVCENYLGDPGNRVGADEPQTFSVTIPSGQTFVIVVNANRPGNDCGAFCFTMDSVPCTIQCPDSIVATTGPDSTQCGTNVDFATTSPCGGASAVCTDQNGTTVASGDFFPVGTTTVTCTGAGGECGFTITVNDDTPPVVTCPAPTTAPADGSCQAAVPNVVPNVVASDNCTPSGSLTITQSPTEGTLVGVGVTTVTVTVTDDSNNTTTCTTTFTVNDTTNPTVACPANIVRNTDPGQCSAVVTYTTPTAMDGCPGATVSCAPASGTAFPKGTTTVTCTATDASGNTGSCSFSVTVNDNQNPTVVCPANVAVNAPSDQCSAVVNYTTPSGADNCGVSNVACVPASGSTFPLGTTSVTCTATDTSGNTGQCSFNVTVNDVTAPSITCPSNVIVAPGAGVCQVEVEYPAPVVTEACSAPVTVACLPASGSLFPLGVTTVTCMATDGAGNASECSFTVTVLGSAFSITCPDDITVTANATQTGACGSGAVVNYTAPIVTTGPCNGTVTVTCVPAAGSFFPTGVTTVTCTATDVLNQTVSCSFDVTVLSAFGACYVDDSSGDTFREVVDAASPLYGYWEYRVTATGEILCGFAEFVSYVPGRSLVSWDHDDSNNFMDANVNLGAGSAVITVTRRSPYHQFVLRDRNINNDPPCQTN